MKAYINGIGLVSPQKTLDTKDFLTDVVEYNTNSLRCIEPNYKEFISPALARRVGRVIKMSIAAATICLKDAKIAIPDAIISGTGLGCTEDTEKFLNALLDNDEQFLTPTAFVQSTHNTVSAQIALQIKCLNYNFTYVHKGLSFESAVLDGLITLAEGNAQNILIGGHDEMTDQHFKITSRRDYWKKENIPTMEIINSKTTGSVSGEGAAFFVISDQPTDHDYAQLLGVQTIYKPESQQEIEQKISQFLSEHGLTTADIDVVLYGINGDSRFDPVYYNLKNDLFSNSTATYYKHLCGEYQTATSFAMWVAAMILKTQNIPDKILIGENKRKPIKNLLIYNNYMEANQSIFLLSQC